MCHNPAILFSVERRGFIKEGYYADLVLIDLKKDEKILKENLLYKCGWSPLEGKFLKVVLLIQLLMVIYNITMEFFQIKETQNK